MGFLDGFFDPRMRSRRGRAVVRASGPGETPRPSNSVVTEVDHEVESIESSSLVTAIDIGDPGRAARHHIPKFDRRFPEVHDAMFDGFRTYRDEQRTTASFDVRAASLRGVSHRHEGIVRQDAYCIGQSPDGRYLVAAVADGVSNATLSHLAAEATVQSLAVGLAERLDEIDPDSIPWADEFRSIVDRHWRSRLQGHLDSRLGEATRAIISERNQDLPEDFEVEVLTPVDIASVMATTVVVAIIETDDERDAGHRVWLARVGDTSGWLLRRTDSPAVEAPLPEAPILPSTEPETALEASSEEMSATPASVADEAPTPRGRWTPLGIVKNEGAQIAESGTAALPSFDDHAVCTETTHLDSDHVLVLMTDGIGDPLGGGNGMVGERLAELWANPPTALEFASHCDFARKSFDDDRTAIAIWSLGDQHG